MIYAVSARAQELLVEKHCFGDCGKILVGAIVHNMIGKMYTCREDICPHIDRELDFFELDGEKLILRKLK
jgi:hypothetical protein